MRSQDVILGMLMKTSASGYEIKRTLETVFSHFYNASFGTIYPTLSKMEAEGLITKESLVQAGKPNKNIYTITERGRQAFRRYLESELEDLEIKSDFMLRLFFGEWAEPQVIRRWLETAIRGQEKTLAKLREERERSWGAMSPTQRICMKIGIANTESFLQHLRDGLAEFEKEERGT